MTQHVDASEDISLTTPLVRSESMLYSEVDGEVTMMSVETGRYYSLTSVGARIWTLLEQAMPASRICDQLLTEYRVERRKCEDEVLAVLRKMAGEGVVRKES